jgi:hypothetical protein
VEHCSSDEQFGRGSSFKRSSWIRTYQISVIFPQRSSPSILVHGNRRLGKGHGSCWTTS